MLNLFSVLAKNFGNDLKLNKAVLKSIYVGTKIPGILEGGTACGTFAKKQLVFAVVYSSVYSVWKHDLFRI